MSASQNHLRTLVAVRSSPYDQPKADLPSQIECALVVAKLPLALISLKELLPPRDGCSRFLFHVFCVAPVRLRCITAHIPTMVLTRAPRHARSIGVHI